jgi:hypothetical protein
MRAIPRISDTRSRVLPTPTGACATRSEACNGRRFGKAMNGESAITLCPSAVSELIAPIARAVAKFLLEAPKEEPGPAPLTPLTR